MPVNEFGQPIGDPVDVTAARRPEPVTLAGRSCRLEPLAVGHAGPLLEDLRAGAGDEQWTYMPFAPPTGVADFDPIVASRAADPESVAFAIVVGDRRDVGGQPGVRSQRVVGTASLLRIAPQAGTIEVGYIMYGAGARRATPATEAMFLLAGHVFDDLGYRRYEWKCDALNEPSRLAAARLGFTFEGVWRQATHYKGRNRDTAWYAMTDSDWRRLRPGYKAWLAQADPAADRDPAGRADQAGHSDPAGQGVLAGRDGRGVTVRPLREFLGG